MFVSLENQAVIYTNRGDANETLKVVAEGITLAEEFNSNPWKARFILLKANALLFAW